MDRNLEDYALKLFDVLAGDPDTYLVEIAAEDLLEALEIVEAELALDEQLAEDMEGGY